MIKVLFFARIAEQLGVRELQHQVPVDIGHLRQQLMQRDPHWQQVLGASNVVCAVNQHIVHDETLAVQAGDEVAFYPPVTGG